jgi:hypothetical protein
MPESALAGLPRLVRIAPELRFRGQAAGGIAVATAGYWAFAWLVGEPMRVGLTLMALGAVALPTLAVSGLPSGERVREALRRTLPPPRAALHETPADGRERRTRLAGIVVTGVMVLLMFDVLTDGGGVMAGLIAGLFGALGTVDWIDARRWERAERVREARLFLLVRPHALSARFGAAQVYELSRPRRPEPLGSGVGPFDLGL